MSIHVNVGNMDARLDVMPNECPYCHNKIAPTPMWANKNDNMGKASVVFRCNYEKCRELFIGYYTFTTNTNGGGWSSLASLSDISIGTNKVKEFHKSISVISPSFIEIFNQAFAAEQYKLLQICGVGYRKALEFLIKDFSIKNKPEKEDEIKKGNLAKVIEDHIEDSRIKIVAKRAVWLGNDETHYVRKWETKDLTDLKNLIDLTLTMIQAESDFEELKISMPEGK
ncbi:MAG TPA: DUF4145 domain-containing protein [Bacteroidia bacterium]|jgi:hypothetical protein|nr:DUF4145 domain-containing protein [Bacteroidia bacterium]